MKIRNLGKRLWALLLAAAIGASLTACGAGSQTGTGGQSEQAAGTDGGEIVLAGYRNLAPGEKDGYYCSKILYVW